jgi:hypothetical protein
MCHTEGALHHPTTGQYFEADALSDIIFDRTFNLFTA